MNREPAEVDLGEWLHGELADYYGLETGEWAQSQVARVSERLNAVRPPELAIATEVLWVSEMTAFTAPCRYAYISRALLQRAGNENRWMTAPGSNPPASMRYCCTGDT